MNDFWENSGWQLVHRQVNASREGRFVPFRDLPLELAAIRYLENHYPTGIYQHQRTAIETFGRGENPCMTTGTSSGKTLPFVVSAINILASTPDAKVIALYPMKALGYEQEERWRGALNGSGLGVSVGRIDGDISDSRERLRILSGCSVVIMTPDVMHAWLLSHVGEPQIAQFIRRLKLVVVDEVHTYTGVFGTNSAFLFRRLYHLNAQMGGSYRYFCASATMRDAASHLRSLTGMDFSVIDSRLDSSPRYETQMQLISPPPTVDFLTCIAMLLKAVSQRFQRFIAFTDSRKQTEQIASILVRDGSADDNAIDANTPNLLTTLDVLPYRAGYEEYDRKVIQDRLTMGGLRGSQGY